MFFASLRVINSVWLSVVLGTGLLLASTGVGWAMGRAASQPPVRLIGWWLRHVVLRLLRTPSWWRRAGGIFANNVTLLAVLLAVGRWQLAAFAGVLCLGVSLGIGIRLLSDEALESLWPASGSMHKRRARLGIALNLLEPPAIMLTMGLSLGCVAVPLTPADVWATFAVWVIPALLLAAAGEALWLGAGYPAHTGGCMEKEGRDACS